jgi:hypothetical protein
MQGANLIRLIEEMIDLKIQQHSESHLKPTSEVAKLLEEKRHTDRRRLEQIKADFVRIIEGRS